MKPDALHIKTAATSWVTATPSALQLIRGEVDSNTKSNPGDRWRPTQAELAELSLQLAGWQSVRGASEALLEQVSVLFDRIAEAEWPPDVFGERYELCSALAFLGWRHATGLDLEIESQAWLRVSDVIMLEPFVENESITASLFDPPGQEPLELGSFSLGRPLEIYLDLAVLRRERGRRQSDVLRVAVRLYDHLLEVELGSCSSTEKAFFLGELASLAATLWRALGTRKECAAWVQAARLHFRGANAREPLLAKVRLIEAVEALNLHHYASADRDLPELLRLSQQFEMPKETLLCNLVLALSLKDRGENARAGAILKEIVNEWRDSSEQSLFSAAASALAEILSADGDTFRASELAAEALLAARGSGDRFIEANAWSFVAILNRNDSNLQASISAFRNSVRLYEEAPSQRMAAYMRVSLADLLIENGRWADALQELLCAEPVIRSENMILEGVHALKLLSMLPREFSSEKMALRNALAMIRKVDT